MQEVAAGTPAINAVPGNCMENQSRQLLVAACSRYSWRKKPLGTHPSSAPVGLITVTPCHLYIKHAKRAVAEGSEPPRTLTAALRLLGFRG